MSDQQRWRTWLVPGASAEQTAAIVAALERFRRARSGAPLSAPAQGDGWLRTALLDGVARWPEAELPDPWINT